MMADLLNREEREALVASKMEEMKKKNELIRQRHAEIEAEKQSLGAAAQAPHALSIQEANRPQSRNDWQTPQFKDDWEMREDEGYEARLQRNSNSEWPSQRPPSTNQESSRSRGRHTGQRGGQRSGRGRGRKPIQVEGPQQPAELLSPQSSHEQPHQQPHQQPHEQAHRQPQQKTNQQQAHQPQQPHQPQQQPHQQSRHHPQQPHQQSHQPQQQPPHQVSQQGHPQQEVIDLTEDDLVDLNSYADTNHAQSRQHNRGRGSRRSRGTPRGQSRRGVGSGRFPSSQATTGQGQQYEEVHTQPSPSYDETRRLNAALYEKEQETLKQAAAGLLSDPYREKSANHNPATNEEHRAKFGHDKMSQLRHPRNFAAGEDLREKIKRSQQRQAAANAPLEVTMTGRERDSYDRWRAERETVDRDRMERAKTTGGTWRREWDNEKQEVVSTLEEELPPQMTLYQQMEQRKQGGKCLGGEEFGSSRRSNQRGGAAASGRGRGRGNRKPVDPVRRSTSSGDDIRKVKQVDGETEITVTIPNSPPSTNHTAKNRFEQDTNHQTTNRNKPSAGADNSKPSPRPDNNKLSQGANKSRPPQRMDNSKQSQGADSHKPSQRADNFKPSQGADNSKPSQGADNSKPSQATDNSKPSQGAVNDKPEGSQCQAAPRPKRARRAPRPKTWDDTPSDDTHVKSSPRQANKAELSISHGKPTEHKIKDTTLQATPSKAPPTSSKTPPTHSKGPPIPKAPPTSRAPPTPSHSQPTPIKTPPSPGKGPPLVKNPTKSENKQHHPYDNPQSSKQANLKSVQENLISGSATKPSPVYNKATVNKNPVARDQPVTKEAEFVDGSDEFEDEDDGGWLTEEEYSGDEEDEVIEETSPAKSSSGKPVSGTTKTTLIASQNTATTKILSTPQQAHVDRLPNDQSPVVVSPPAEQSSVVSSPLPHQAQVVNAPPSSSSQVVRSPSPEQTPEDILSPPGKALIESFPPPELSPADSSPAPQLAQVDISPHLSQTQVDNSSPPEENQVLPGDNPSDDSDESTPVASAQPSKENTPKPEDAFRESAHLSDELRATNQKQDNIATVANQDITPDKTTNEISSSTEQANQPVEIENALKQLTESGSTDQTRETSDDQPADESSSSELNISDRESLTAEDGRPDCLITPDGGWPSDWDQLVDKSSVQASAVPADP